MEPWGQTDLEFLVEIILNRSDPKKPVGPFGRITTDNTLPERDSEGADPQRELRNVRPNSLEKAMRSNQASPRARGPALLRTGASATSSCARLVPLDASAMGRHGALGSDRFRISCGDNSKSV